MVACVDEGTPAPPELLLAWQCERWNTLPDIGGLYQQDARTINLMGALSTVYDALSHLRNSTGEQIHSLSEAERRTLKKLIDMGLLFNE